MGVIGDLNVRLDLQTKAFNRKIKGVEFRLNKLARKTAAQGQKLTQNLTLPLLAAGVASVKLASDFEFSMTKITSQVGIAAKEVESMKKDVLELSGKTAQAPRDLAEAMFFIQSAGLRGAEAMEALEFAAKGSATGFGETKVVADLMTSAMNAFASSNLTAEQSMDVLAATVREGKADASELTAAMGAALPQAVAMGIGFDQLGASVAAMTRTGTSAGEAVTQLKSIMMVFQKPSKEAEKIATKLGTSMGELRNRIKKEGLLTVLVDLRKKLKDNGIETAEFFRKSQALNGVLDLTGDGMEENIKISERLAAATGSANKAFEVAAQTSQFKFKQALVDLQVVGVELGATLLPMATKLAKNISGLAKSFASLDQGTKNTIIATAGLVAVMGPMLSIGSNLILVYKNVAIGLAKVAKAMLGAERAQKLLNMAAKAAPWVLLFTAVAAAVTIFIKLKNQLSAIDEINKEANRSISAQKKQVQLLTGVLNDENSTLQNKETALKKLQKISPKYYGHLKIAKGDVIGLKKANEGYNDSLLRTAQQLAINNKIQELAKEAFDAKESFRKLTSQNALTQGLIATGAAMVGQVSPAATLAGRIKFLNEEMERLNKLSLEFTENAPLETPVLTDPGGGGGGGAEKAENTRLTTEETEAIAAQTEARIALIKSIRDELISRGEVAELNAEAAETDEQRMERIWAETAAKQEQAEAFSEIWAKQQAEREAEAESLGLIEEGANAMAQGLMNASRDGIKSGKELGRAMLKEAKNAIAAQLAVTVASAVKSAVQNMPYPLNLILGPLAGAAAFALFNTAVGKIAGFKDGVTNFQGGLAVVGETGPELVSLASGSNVHSNQASRSMLRQSGGGGGMTFIPEVIIQGSDLRIVFDREQERQRRIE